MEVHDNKFVEVFFQLFMVDFSHLLCSIRSDRSKCSLSSLAVEGWITWEEVLKFIVSLMLFIFGLYIFIGDNTLLSDFNIYRLS